ncbi:hypothetical protein CONLIGDRAFT_707814 [Coniochaeta ligniaria NRRL 30616]|uniref:Uncharacterized protein n=1 Tax=Coniochaeta ligniaria NRRL 30616 TaxID=1408157 RepID=A0A1J7JBB7_9PEZI|nr:hypothetical protein CONLIGDRAFT_707814 [Coniochaeta ligniaria NRRL 30616]
MDTASFHRFTFLPPEIQQQIWMLAAESTPGAHFFTYTSPDEESEITRQIRNIRRTTVFGPYLTLGMPDDNRSVVRIAGQENTDDFLLGTYQDKGVTRNVIVRSNTDLIIICPADLGQLCWSTVKADCPGFEHFALEYDPSWPRFGQGPPLTERGKEACECLASLASDGGYKLMNVWFIDYSLRRRPDADGNLPEYRRRFWCATGRFVEVWACQNEDWYTGPEDGVHKLVASLRKDRETRLKLAEDLEEMGIHMHGDGVEIPPPEPEDPDATPESEDFPRGPWFGVLAFEPWSPGDRVR